MRFDNFYNAYLSHNRIHFKYCSAQLTLPLHLPPNSGPQSVIQLHTQARGSGHVQHAVVDLMLECLLHNLVVARVVEGEHFLHGQIAQQAANCTATAVSTGPPQLWGAILAQ